MAVLSIGTTSKFAARAIELAAQQGFDVAHYDLRFAKPLDEALLHEVAAKFKRVITVEDGVLRGGVGEAVSAFFNNNGYNVKCRTLGIDDRFVEQGTPSELYAECGYDADGVLGAIIEA